MCCRISTTGFATRTIAGLYIFLATFLIGFFAVQGKAWLFPLSLTEIEKEELVYSVKEPKTPGPGVNQDGPLGIEYLYTEPLPDYYEAVFEATNFGSEPILLNDGSSSLDVCSLHEATRPGIYITGSSKCDIDKVLLNPSESTEIHARVYYDGKGYLLLVKYLTSDRKEYRTKLVVNEIHKPKYEPFGLTR